MTGYVCVCVYFINVLDQPTHHTQQAGKYGLIPCGAFICGNGIRAWAVGGRGCETQVESQTGGVDFLAVEGGVAVVGYGEGEWFRECGDLGFSVCGWGREGGG